MKGKYRVILICILFTGIYISSCGVDQQYETALDQISELEDRLSEVEQERNEYRDKLQNIESSVNDALSEISAITECSECGADVDISAVESALSEIESEL